MKTTRRAATAALLATGLGLAAAAPASAAMELSDISDATRIADGAAVEGTYTVTCTEGTNVFVSLSVTQAVSDGRIANGSDFEQWTCEGGQVELTYQAVAYNMAFQPGEAVVSGFIQECQDQVVCGPGTNLPLIVIEVEDADGTTDGTTDGAADEAVEEDADATAGTGE
ncbi:hypothetical protein MRU69_00050 [Kocuria flava]|uniref:hypothetical protein n=1 Tax=Kocuria flava TaxID=446860 RepID=UPI001FF1C82C|nr:hypothetical protein [Kocuria flava]MCJ8503255.1 hypothetical protein [Kocuria flava]